jgi:hypothetical protein
MPKVASVPTLGESRSTSIRAIENGWLVTHAESGAKGYRSTECYTPDKPNLDYKPAPATRKRTAAPSSLRIATTSLKDH